MLRCSNVDCRASIEFTVGKTKDRQGFTVTIENGTPKVIMTDGAEMIESHVVRFLHDNRKYKAKCKTCGKSDKLGILIDAYLRPMNFFDTNNLCSCGGEIWNDVEAQKGMELPDNAEWEGSQRKVAMSVKITKRCERCGKVFK